MRKFTKGIVFSALLGAALAFSTPQVEAQTYKPKVERKTINSKVLPSEMKKVWVYPELDPTLAQAINKVQKLKDEDYQTLISEVDTPIEAVAYNISVLTYKDDIDVYGKKEHWASFKHIHKNKKDDCDGGVIAAAALLSDNGFPPYIAVLSQGPKKLAHVVFVYRTIYDEYGSIGINWEDYVTEAKSLEEIMKIINKRLKKNFKHITVYDLSREFPDFIDNDVSNRPIQSCPQRNCDLLEE